MTVSPYQQIVNLYKEMASAGYRPAAPGDGFGNICPEIGDDDLQIYEEGCVYAEECLKAEREGKYWIGVPDYSTAYAMWCLVEAAKACCANNPKLAHTLTSLAIKHLDVEVAA